MSGTGSWACVRKEAIFVGTVGLKGGKMRKRVFFLCCCALFFVPLVSAAQTSGPKEKVASESLPPIVVLGLEAYKSSGPEEAVQAWIKGSAIDGSKDALSQTNLLRQIQDYYGAYRAFEIVSTKDLSPKTRVIYLVLDFEKGPLFAKFVVYRSGQAWILAYFNFNTKEELVFPSCP
ncbi:MAG: hypothetical protein ABSD63_16245 [Candidatus Korobacteraceae bacterium]|jgi:hypothetical protein